MAGSTDRSSSAQGSCETPRASDFLWEDFTDSSMRPCFPMLSPYAGIHALAGTPETLDERMQEALKGAQPLAEKGERLNRFKDREIFFIDLDHILHPESTFDSFALSLTRLAERVVDEGARLVYEDLTERFGRPRTVAALRQNMPSWAGKLGGASLGYASDLEFSLLTTTAAQRTETNRSRTRSSSTACQRGDRFDQVKAGGIFQLDLRLGLMGTRGRCQQPGQLLPILWP